MNKQELKQFNEFFPNDKYHSIKEIKELKKDLKTFISQIKANHRQEIIHDILETILQERDKADEIDKNGYDHSYAIVKGFLK